jgi:hypothetical protein
MDTDILMVMVPILSSGSTPLEKFTLSNIISRLIKESKPSLLKKLLR